MRNLFTLLILILPLILFGQEISFNKDSLHLFITENNPDAADTLWIKNSGSIELIIDSIISHNSYGYKIEFANSDTSFLYGVPSDFENDISLMPDDSFRVVFSNPDRCPFCKLSAPFETLTDTVIFVSNSVLNEQDRIVIIIDEAANIESEETYPSEFLLFQNYPNPFNPETLIRFYLPKSAFTSLEIYNSLGQNVEELVNGFLSSGYYQIVFNGSELPSGIYYYSLRCGNQVKIKQMAFIK